MRPDWMVPLVVQSIVKEDISPEMINDNEIKSNMKSINLIYK